jgi:hypothetical protein
MMMIRSLLALAMVAFVAACSGGRIDKLDLSDGSTVEFASGTVKDAIGPNVTNSATFHCRKIAPVCQSPEQQCPVTDEKVCEPIATATAAGPGPLDQTTDAIVTAAGLVGAAAALRPTNIETDEGDTTVHQGQGQTAYGGEGGDAYAEGGNASATGGKAVSRAQAGAGATAIIKNKGKRRHGGGYQH